MNWSDERYVRVYVRDTADWLALSFDAQALLLLLLRKLDRAGVLELGRQGPRAVAVAIGHGHLWERLQPALEELLADGCVQINGAQLVVPNYLRAQEARASDRLRQRETRARRAEEALANGADEIEARRAARPDRYASQRVTAGHSGSPDGHAGSHAVTAGHSMPSHAVPSHTQIKNTCSTGLSVSVPPAGERQQEVEPDAPPAVRPAPEQPQPLLTPIEPRWTPDFKAVYDLYPRKQGKAAGLASLRRDVKTPADYEDLRRVCVAYVEALGPLTLEDLRFVPYFSTWANGWRQYLDPAVLADLRATRGAGLCPGAPRKGRGLSALDILDEAERLEAEERRSPAAAVCGSTITNDWRNR